MCNQRRGEDVVKKGMASNLLRQSYSCEPHVECFASEREL